MGRDDRGAISVSGACHARLARYAAARGVTMSAVVEQLIERLDSPPAPDFPTVDLCGTVLALVDSLPRDLDELCLIARTTDLQRADVYGALVELTERGEIHRDHRGWWR